MIFVAKYKPQNLNSYIPSETFLELIGESSHRYHCPRIYYVPEMLLFLWIILLIPTKPRQIPTVLLLLSHEDEET